MLRLGSIAIVAVGGRRLVFECLVVIAVFYIPAAALVEPMKERKATSGIAVDQPQKVS